MADISKLIEDLKSDANAAAKDAKLCAIDGTYQDVVEEAEALMESLAMAYSPELTFAILAVASTRYKTVLMHRCGTLPVVEFLIDIANETHKLGMQVDDLKAATIAWHETIVPRKETP